MRTALLWVCGISVLTASVIPIAAAGQSKPFTFPNGWFEPVVWNDLEGWSADDHAAALAAFLASCRPILADPGWARDSRPVAVAMKGICHRAKAAFPLHSAAARAFFEGNFRPLRIGRLGDAGGFLTAYYEPILNGSRFPTPVFHTPLYRRPEDLVALGSTAQGDGFPNRAQVGRRVDGRVVPYFDRGQIEGGALDGRHLEICWVADPIDALIVQIEGSARVRLEDGAMLRVNYAAHNGFPYTSIGRVLVERNLMSKDETSFDRIRKWMRANPEQASEVRRTNRSYVFFRISGLGDEEPPAGGQGVRLTPGRSIAVDTSVHVYGTPFFISADLPRPGEKGIRPFRRLMIAQDTGSAIVGPARADLFFGTGDEAGHAAGQVRQSGQFVMLVPRAIDPVAASSHVPQPRSRPVFEAKAVAQAGHRIQHSRRGLHLVAGAATIREHSVRARPTGTRPGEREGTRSGRSHRPNGAQR
jgi:membrane-bound lytic murein transglycosylase A